MDVWPRVVLVLALAVLSGCGSPSRLLFYPMQPLVRTPAELGVTYEEVTLTTSDGLRLHAWYLPAAGKARGNILFLHGNAENISTHVANVAWLPAEGYGVLALDYRGYGRSEGTPRLPEVLEDLAAGSGWLSAHTAPPYVILGQSLGAALAAGFSSDQRATPFVALVLDAPFARYREIGRHALGRGWLSRLLLAPAANLLPDGYDPIDHIGRQPRPSLFFSSAADTIVPLAQTRSLYQAAPAPKQLSLHQGSHTATFNDPHQRQVLLDFLAHHAVTPSPVSSPLPSF